jgi:hypothetical protein
MRAFEEDCHQADRAAAVSEESEIDGLDLTQHGEAIQ